MESVVAGLSPNRAHIYTILIPSAIFPISIKTIWSVLNASRLETINKTWYVSDLNYVKHIIIIIIIN